MLLWLAPWHCHAKTQRRYCYADIIQSNALCRSFKNWKRISGCWATASFDFVPRSTRETSPYGSGHRGKEILHRCGRALQRPLLKFLLWGVREWYTHYNYQDSAFQKNQRRTKTICAVTIKQPVSPYGLRCLYSPFPLLGHGLHGIPFWKQAERDAEKKE